VSPAAPLTYPPASSASAKALASSGGSAWPVAHARLAAWRVELGL
jgi:hypothetical protein